MPEQLLAEGHPEETRAVGNHDRIDVKRVLGIALSGIHRHLIDLRKRKAAKESLNDWGNGFPPGHIELKEGIAGNIRTELADEGGELSGITVPGIS